ncbi:Protein ssh4 [Senna tora]|uniref:Protein ssh4 n=1 Tax=Senna tora TaxID=362788 RepID=A0A834TXW2_9FABA|nr:Protein ssh4 [Senna tora]
MLQRIHVAVVAASVGCVSTLLLVFILRWCYRRNRTNLVQPSSLTRTPTLQSATTARLHNQHQHQHQHSIHHQLDLLHGPKNKSNYFAFRRGISGTPFFTWADHPSLAADAVENGWSRFGFTAYKTHMSSPSKRSSLLGVCAAGDHGRESEAEITWEVSHGSPDFMQKIRLNPGLNKKTLNPNNSSSMSVASVIRTALPLPGPPLGNCSFPQEAYFEITILYSRGDDCESLGKNREGEKTKLIQDGLTSKGKSEALAHVTSNHKVNNIEEIRLDGRTSESVKFSLGLTAGGSVPFRVPGSYPGSIGFNSNGSVFLDGMKLVFESDKAEWVGSDKVIGCGFDPRQKKVFFTLDSELVHVIHCQSEEFGTPLYPTLAANIDILVLINFGQSPFKYAPANAQRTPNPCFIAPLVNSPINNTLSYDDSKELFSMGRIDSQWLNRSATTKATHNNIGSNNRVVDFDEESEADLFEIVLDGSAKTPNSTS